MRIAITGANGFVGTAMTGALEAGGDTVVRLVRGNAPYPGCARWNPDTGEIDASALGTIDAVVHLAGENVAGGRWTPRRQTAIRNSRGPATTALCQTLTKLRPRPQTLISASGVGIYGDRGDDLLDEDASPGTGFLAEVARAWEAGTAPASESGMRVVNLRIGMVLDPTGGALAKMLLPFRLGLGGRLGAGYQWVSWITRRDLVAAMRFALEHTALRGPVHAVAPQPVTNREFTRTLAQALRRPAFLPAPAFLLRLVLGQMADALLLASQRAVPSRLLEAGFSFADPQLGPALEQQLSRLSRRS